MNTSEPIDLPELSEERVEDLERALFADIARERTDARSRRTRRTRVWSGVGAAAAVLVVAAVIAPSLGGIVGAGGSSADYAVAPAAGPDAVDPGTFSSADEAAVAESGGARGVDLDDPSRDIITSASASVVTDDVEASARAVSNAAVAVGGYVESMNVGTSGAKALDGTTYEIYPYPPVDGAWVSVRVPAGELDGLIADLADVGDVTSTSVNRQDVTEQTVDLRARVEAMQASVDRLTELLGQAGSLADVIAAETALSDRQAELESYTQQLEMLEGQVAMSSLTVSLTPEVETVQADPAGFWDGVVAGWNGLVASLNGLVLAIGFLLPWLGVLGLAALVVWLVVRARRRRSASAPSGD